MQVVGFGLTVVDILMVTKDVTLYDKNHVSQQIVQMGGVVPTALMVLSRLGVTCRFSTGLGKDHFGEMLKKTFEQEHIEMGSLVEYDDSTPLSVVVVNNLGERTSFVNRGPFPTLSHDKFTPMFDEDTKFFLTEGHNPDSSYMHLLKAHEKGIKVGFDCGNPKPGMEQMVRDSDILFIPQSYWRVTWPNLTPLQIAQELLREKPERIIAITMGKNGSLIGTKDEIFHQITFEVEPVDTNGAGDVFMGAFIFGLVQGWDMRKIAQFSSATSAWSTTSIGKDQKIPKSIEEINTLITEHQVKHYGQAKLPIT